MSEEEYKPEEWDRDAINSLLRFGRKNSGPWDESTAVDKNGRELDMPDDGDTDLVVAAPYMRHALELWEKHIHISIGVDDDSDEGFLAMMNSRSNAIEAMNTALAKMRGEQ